MERQYVIFSLAGEQYGVEIAAIERIIGIQRIVAVPHSPSFVAGVTYLRERDAVLPVIDLRRRFGLPPQDIATDTRIMVVEVTTRLKAGMIVDAVLEVLDIPGEKIELPSPLLLTARSAFITGIAKMDGNLIIILNMAKVFSRQEKTDLQSWEESLGTGILQDLKGVADAGPHQRKQE